MKKGKINVFIILFMICLAMTGCEKENSESTSTDKNDTEEVLQWKATHSPMQEQYEGAVINEGKIYAYQYGISGIDISVFSTDTMERMNSYTIADVIEVKNISINAAEQICLWGSTEIGNTLWQISSTGEISIIEDIEVEDLGSFPDLKSFYADSNGYYYIWYEMSVPSTEVYEDGEEGIYIRLDRIYVKDQQMNTIIYEEVPDFNNNKLLSLAFDEEGSLLILAKDVDGYYVQRVRTTDREKYEATRLETSELLNLENNNLMVYTKDELLYVLEGALYRYHLSDFRNEKLLELASVGILEEDIIYLDMKDNIIEIIDNYKGIQQSEYTTITEGQDEKKQLTLAVMSLQSDMRKLITSFNRYQNEVEIEPIIYVQDGDYDAGYEKLLMDVIQGKAPDLISAHNLGYENLAKLGAFSDLYSFMQEDAELKEEDLVSDVLKVYEIEGHLYTIAPAFRIYTLWGAASTVEGQTGVNAEELIQILKSKGGDINSIYGFSPDESVLTTLCAFNMDKFIDWSNGTCDFTGTEFQQIINFAKEYTGTPFDSLYKAIRSGDILLTLAIINSVEDYRLESELYGENVQFIGYPTESGNGIAALLAEEVAINSKSELQKEAWEFIKYYMQNGYRSSGFPVMQEQFEQVLNESMNEVLINENGELSKFSKVSYSENNVVNIQVSKSEPEDVEAIRTLVSNISDKFQYHTEIQKIIEEEVSAYFYNQKELEEVCKIIQNRVHLYLNER